MFKDSSQFYDYEILQLATAFTERRSETIIFENIFVKTMTYLSRLRSQKWHQRTNYPVKYRNDPIKLEIRRRKEGKLSDQFL